MKYLFAFDMDGTLLNDKSQLSDVTIKTIHNIKNEGHLVVLASGRSYLGMKPYYDDLKLNTPVISLNGSSISYPDGKVINHLIEKELVEKLFIDLKALFESFLINATDGIYSYKHNKDLEILFNGTSGNKVFDLEAVNYSFDNVLNIVVIVKENNRYLFEEYFHKNPLTPRFWGIVDGIALYDLSLSTISKATALKDVLAYYQKDYSKLIAFGDGINDIEMLQLSPNGVAMKNGLEKTKKAANNVTAFDNNNDGVANYIIELLKNDR